MFWFSITESTGASLTGETWSTNEVSSEYSPSVTVIVIPISPYQSALGVTVNWSPSTTISALSLVEEEKTNSSSSTSFADKDKFNELSSSIFWSDNAVITGASLTGRTVKVNDVESTYSPSLTLTSKVISPLKSWIG